MNQIRWRKSTYSSNGGASCIEVAATDHVLVRDTKQDGTGPMLRFTPAAWRKFADHVKHSLVVSALSQRPLATAGALSPETSPTLIHCVRVDTGKWARSSEIGPCIKSESVCPARRLTIEATIQHPPP